MPLLERNVNVRITKVDNVRPSSTSTPTSIRVHDENTAPFTVKAFQSPAVVQAVTPPMAFTEGLQTPPISRPQSQSRIPRSSSLARGAGPLPDSAVSIDEHSAPKGYTYRNDRHSLRTPMHKNVEAVKQITPRYTRVPDDKPLPSRPVASVTTGLSPTKDSRCIVDAGEKPLTVLVDDQYQNWPALTPTSKSSPATGIPLMPRHHDTKEPHLTSPINAPVNAPMVTSPHEGPNDAADTQLAEHDDYSGLRPRSLSHGRRFVCPSPAFSITSVDSKIATERTASRIPIPNSIKAAVVEVKSKSSSAGSSICSVQSPTFGSRRLDAPGALKILDQGIKRRQQKQGESFHTANETTDPTSAALHDGDCTRTTECENDSSFGSTIDATTTEEEDTSTPYEAAARRRTISLVDEDSPGYFHAAAVKLFNGAVASMGKAPPSTSPFTQPLQTIPSESVLPLHKRSSPPLRTSFDSTSDDPSEAEEPAVPFPPIWTSRVIEQRSNTTSNSMRDSLADFLKGYERDDEQCSRSSLESTVSFAQGSNPLALRLLEGHGASPVTTVDDAAVLRSFGHLKRAVAGPPKTSSMADKAAAAQKFIAQADQAASKSDDSTHHKVAPKTIESVPGWPFKSDVSQNGDTTSRHQDIIPPKKSLPPPSLGAPMKSTNAPMAAPISAEPIEPSSSLSRKAVPPRGTTSRIPSRVNGSNAIALPPQEEVVNVAANRTAGKQMPGSIKTARETLENCKGGFSRSTIAVESKKATKGIDPTRPAVTGDGIRRGRLPVDETSKDNTSTEKKRTQSKSRLMLGKINSLFSGKREKQSSMPASIPTVKEDSSSRPMSGRGDIHSVSSNLKPSSSLSVHGTLPKMPTMSAMPSDIVLSRKRPAADKDTSTEGASTSNVTDSVAIRTWSEALIRRAEGEAEPSRKERLLSFAKVLNDSLINAREAQISAETAEHAARSAKMSYELTQKSLVLLHKLAASMAG